MSLNYSEGTWFAVPLRTTGFAVGLVARASRAGGVILVYLFGPRRAAVPELGDILELSPGSAVRVVRMGDLHIIDGKWPIIGQSARWRRDEWPMPRFVRSDPLAKREWIVRYADDDPNSVVSEELVAFGTSALARDSVLGAGAVEILVTKALP